MSAQLSGHSSAQIVVECSKLHSHSHSYSTLILVSITCRIPVGSNRITLPNILLNQLEI